MESSEKKKRDISITPVLAVFAHAAKKEWGWGIASLSSVLIASILGLAMPIFYKRFFDTLGSASGIPNESTISALLEVLLFIALVNGAGWIVWRFHEVVDARFQLKTMNHLLNDAFGKLLFHSYSFFTNSFTGSSVRKVTRLPHAFERFKDTLIYEILTTAVLLIGVPFILIERSVMLGVGFLVFAAILIVFHIAVASWKQKYNVASAEKDTALTAAISDSIANEYTVKLFAQESGEMKYVFNASMDALKARMRSIDIDSVINVFQSGLMIVTEIVLLYITIRLWGQGMVTIGDFAMVQAYLISASGRLWGFNRTIRAIYESLADATEMVDIINTPYEVGDHPHPKPLTVTKAQVVFDRVTFLFNQTRTVLDNFSLTVLGGQRIALVGSSGAGKSTIVKLLLRLHDVAAGAITIDGANIAQVRQSDLRQAIGFVPQEPLLFHRTLMENIRYGKSDATDDEVIMAAKLAHCHEFIVGLPEKYETFVGERGVKLSGGERQRVAIARAILKNAPILILDEATSSLDSESEQYIQDALEVLMRNKTVIVIAHRLSTIMRMDRIMVIENGVVTDQGTHAELLKKEGLYKKLWSIQAGGFIAD